MMTSLEKDPRFTHLYEHNSSFRELTEKHRELSREVGKMQKAAYLDPARETLMHELKKKKLGVKDRMEAMLEEVPA